MKEMESLENHCVPGGRAARRRGLSGGCSARRPGSRRKAWLLGSLAPAVACALLTLSMFNPANTGHSARHEPLIAMILSNQNYAAYASDGFADSENNLAAVTFEWTNRNISTSNMAPF